MAGEKIQLISMYITAPTTRLLHLPWFHPLYPTIRTNYKRKDLCKHLRHMGCCEDEPRRPNETPQNSSNHVHDALKQGCVTI
jgi:hypothetical protein